AAGTLYLDTGVVWVTIAAGVTVGTLAARPVAGSAGRVYLATDLGRGTFFVDTGAAWLAIPSAYDAVSADTTVSNTAVETTIYTKSILANTLGTAGKLRLVLEGKVSDTHVSVNAASYTLRFKYGATTLITSAAIATHPLFCVCAGPGFGANRRYRLTFELSADGAAVQLGWYFTNHLVSPGPAQQTLWDPGTSAEDSTQAKNPAGTE